MLGTSAPLGVGAQWVAIDGTSFLLKFPKAVVTNTASKRASEKRRKAERLFPCPFLGCGDSFTRKSNLKGEQSFIIALWRKRQPCP